MRKEGLESVDKIQSVLRKIDKYIKEVCLLPNSVFKAALCVSPLQLLNRR